MGVKRKPIEHVVIFKEQVCVKKTVLLFVLEIETMQFSIHILYIPC
jgi:hypothetical protein